MPAAMRRLRGKGIKRAGLSRRPLLRRTRPRIGLLRLSLSPRRWRSWILSARLSIGGLLVRSASGLGRECLLWMLLGAAWRSLTRRRALRPALRISPLLTARTRRR